MCADFLRRYVAAVESALAEEGDPWATFANFMRAVVDEETHSLTLRLAGTFTPTEELSSQAEKAQDLTVQLFVRTMAAGAIRPDLTVNDLSFLFEQLASVHAGNQERTRQLRRRYLALHLDALQVKPTAHLDGPPPSWEELRARWS